jgi:putative photosynthetic complex assembly protein
VPAVTTRQLQFSDQADGSVEVQDVELDTAVGVLAPGEDNFIRGILRALVRQRKLRGLSAEQPFRLSMLADGRLILEDPATGERIDLDSFGSANAGAFRRLLR